MKAWVVGFIANAEEHRLRRLKIQNLSFMACERKDTEIDNKFTIIYSDYNTLMELVDLCLQYVVTLLQSSAINYTGEIL